MKLMLIGTSEETRDEITGIVGPLGFDLIHYRHVLKAMDNIDEVTPTAIIMSARDFPRHWKILAQFVRQQYSKEICPIVLLMGREFSSEQASKACCIGINGLVPEDITEHGEAGRLQNILNRYIRFEDTSNTVSYPVVPENRIGICITNPVNKNIITTTVTAISRNGVTFKADENGLADSLLDNRELCECSLRAGDAILSPICRRTRGPLTRGPGGSRSGIPQGSAQEISMEFSYLSGEEQALLDRYLERLRPAD